MEKPIEKWSFEDLKGYVVRQMFDALITGGAKSMGPAFHMIFNVICQWQDAQKKMGKNKFGL